MVLRVARSTLPTINDYTIGAVSEGARYKDIHGKELVGNE